MRLVYVHGRDQQGRDPASICAEWKDAQVEGLRRAGLGWPDGVEPAMPFYGDELARLVGSLNAPLAGDAPTEAPGSTGARSRQIRLRVEILQELVRGQGVAPPEIARQYALTAVERGVGNWAWVHSLLGLVDRTPLATRALDEVTRDVAVYLTNRNARRRIDEIVRAAIPDTPCVVIAHSLGAIIAYNALRQMPDGASVRLITLGCPLGVRSVQRYLEPPLAMPARVRHWYNALDARDIVALYPLDEQCFAVDPLVENKTTVDNPTSDHHGISGYLHDRDVARVAYLDLTAF